MYLTPPESDETLDKFYTKVRPGGLGWQRQQARTGLAPQDDLAKDLLKVVASTLLLFGLMLGTGSFLLLKSLSGWIYLTIAVAGAVWLRQLSKRSLPKISRPG
jgi:hypothetical protein